MREVLCPACGALVEGASDDELFERARAHTLASHDYDIPREHVLQSASPAD